MPLITHTDCESSALKLGKSLCGKILQRAPQAGTTIYFAPIGPNDAYQFPVPPWSGPGYPSVPNQWYSNQLAAAIAAIAGMSAAMISTYLNLSAQTFQVPGQNPQFGMGAIWNDSTGSFYDLSTLPGLSGNFLNVNPNLYTPVRPLSQSFWRILRNGIPYQYAQNSLTPPYLYQVGQSLAATDSGYGGSSSNFWAVAVYVGSRTWFINQFQYQEQGITTISPPINPVKTVIQPTTGTAPMTYTDGNGNTWTITNGNGWVLIPIPEWNENLAIIGSTGPGSEQLLASVRPPTNAPCGLLNALTII